MKTGRHSLPWVLRLLQICSVLAMAAAVFAVMVSLCLGVMIGTAHLPATLLKTGLWLATWCFFFGLLERLRRESTACTKKNTDALGRIGLCVGALGVVQLIDGVYGALTGDASPTAYQTLLHVVRAGVLPLMFFGAAAVALVLQGLLRNASALRQETELTI